MTLSPSDVSRHLAADSGCTPLIPPFPEILPDAATPWLPRQSEPSGVAEGVFIAQLEHLPHLTEKLTALWRTRELNTFIHRLILDSRDGERRGLPVEVADELLFIAEINRLVRAQEAAPLLEVGLADALELIDRGDRAAAQHSTRTEDPWGGAKHQRRLGSHASVPPADAAIPARPRVERASHPTFRLVEAPPLPDSVRIDVGTLRPLRSDRAGETFWHMDWGLFRCLAREVATLGIRSLEIADFGADQPWPHLSAALRFCRQQCRLAKISVYTDPLTADIGVLAKAMDEGADRIVVEFNMASGRWRTRALDVLALAPDFFRDALARLVEYRDQATLGGRPCTIALASSGRHHSVLLQKAYRDCAALVGVVRYSPSHPGTASAGHAGVPSSLNCWAPFSMAHIRTNGHLVACAQDHSGYSFMADLKQEKLAEAWSGQAFRQTRKRVLCGERPGRQCDICSHRAQKYVRQGRDVP